MEILYIWPDLPVLSIVALLAVSMLFMFLAREPLHNALKSLSDGISGGLYNLATSAENLASAMKERDRKILLESGLAAAQHKLQEEFLRVEVSYGKHLADYPALQRRLDEHICQLESDYAECGQVTPEAPGWNEAVSSIAKVQGTSGDRVIEKVLGEIHRSAVEGEKHALNELRSTMSKRHKILSGMAPVWKKVSRLQDSMSEKINQVLETTGRIDKYMTEYHKISKGNQESIDLLASRASKMFIFSLIIITIAGFGAFVNFQLIALPVSELVPANTRVLGIPVSDFSAMVIICLEVVCGIFLMEALGITSIIPQIANMTRGRRRLVLYVSLVALLLFACAEASLGILREVLAEANTQVTQSLAGANVAIATGESQYTVIGQATLGFLLPWVIAMVAMPLEVLIDTSQHIVGRLLALLVLMMAKSANTAAYLAEQAIKIVMHLYDAYIIIPLQLKKMLPSGEGSHTGARAQKA